MRLHCDLERVVRLAQHDSEHAYLATTDRAIWTQSGCLIAYANLHGIPSMGGLVLVSY